jgi:SPP1 family predicted phage head-tail adaptor
MKAGELRHRLIIEQPAKSKNAIDETVQSWETFATVWGAVEPATGKLFYAAKQLDSTVDGRVRIRYIKGLLPTMRIKLGDRILSIVSILMPQERQREIQIMYTESLD